MERYKDFRIAITLPDGTNELKLVWARTKEEAIQLAMYRDGYWAKQPDRSKYKAVNGKKAKVNITIHAELN